MANADTERYAKEKALKAKPEKPKKAKSEYLLFCEQMRPSVKEEHPKFSAKEIISELGRLWRVKKESETN